MKAPYNTTLRYFSGQSAIPPNTPYGPTLPCRLVPEREESIQNLPYSTRIAYVTCDNGPLTYPPVTGSAGIPTINFFKGDQVSIPSGPFPTHLILFVELVTLLPMRPNYYRMHVAPILIPPPVLRLTFDAGDAQYMNAPSESLLPTGTTPFAFMSRIINAPSQTGNIWHFGRPYPSTGYSVAIVGNVQYFGNNAVNTIGTKNVADGLRHCTFCIFDGAQLSIYTDSSPDSSPVGGVISMTYGGYGITIGRRPPGIVSTIPVTGQFEDFRVWVGTLPTTAQMDVLCAGDTTTNIALAEKYRWSCTEGSGTVCHDAGPSGNDQLFSLTFPTTPTWSP